MRNWLQRYDQFVWRHASLTGALVGAVAAVISWTLRPPYPAITVFVPMVFLVCLRIRLWTNAEIRRERRNES